MKAQTPFLKSLLIFFFISSFILQASSLFSQAPQKFNYQAVVRDGSTILVDKTLDVNFEILQGSPTGSVVWDETQTSVSTNSIGLLNLKVGETNSLNVDWSSGPYYLKVKLDLKDGNGLQDFGSAELLSVPYALYALEGTDADADPANEFQDLSLTGNTLSLSNDPTPVSIDLSPYADNPWTLAGTSNDTLLFGGSVAIGSGMPNGSKLAVQGDNIADEKPLFEVKRQDGQTVFAVYNSGVRMFVEEGESKSRKGGFAIGGFTPGKGETGEYFRVTTDSVRIYLDNSETKGSKGGFAIGGFTPGKGMEQEYLRVTEDSTRIYIDNTATKGSKGGFAIGGFTPGKGSSTEFLNLTPENYFIGHEAGRSMTTGSFNIFLGYNAGMSNTSGSYNSFLGYQSGYTNTIGKYNMFLGYQAGYSNQGSTSWSGNYNSFMGYLSGYSNTTGGQNVFLGYMTGYLNTSGSNNVFLGNNVGYNNNASNNVFVGNKVGEANTTGTANVFLGAQAGFRNQTGNYNVYLGSVAGVNNVDGDANIFIGDHAGYSTTTGNRNIFLGYLSGMNLISGGSNTFIGEMAGINYDQGVNNVFIGPYAGYGGSTGDGSGMANVFIGYSVASNVTTANRNVAIGSSTATSLTTGSDNILLGYNSGENITDGTNNTHIGYYAGAYETGSHTFYLDSRYRSNLTTQINNALMYGTIGSTAPSSRLRINANVGIQAPADAIHTLYITGSAYASGGTWQSSDKRYKKDIERISDASSIIQALKGVRFNFRTDDFQDLGFSDQPQIGVIAQDVESVLPELVTEDEKGYKSVAYDKLTAVLIEAVKEQQNSIEQKDRRIDELEKRIERMEAYLGQIGIK